MTEIPPPDCQYGYTETQLDEILGDRIPEFNGWMWGQTMAICNGDPQREWVDDPGAPGGMKLVETGPPLCESAHGPVVYPWDLARFLEGRPVID